MIQYLFDYIRHWICSVAVLYTLPGERPPAILGDVVSLCCVLSQTVRETWWSSLITFGGSWFDCSFLLHVCGSSLWQHSRQQVCSYLVSTTIACFSYGAGSTPDSKYNSRCTGKLVVSSHELVSCGNKRNSDAVVEWIPAAILVQFASWFIFVRLLRFVLNKVESIVLPHPIFLFFMLFRIILGPQPFLWPRTAL